MNGGCIPGLTRQDERSFFFIYEARAAKALVNDTQAPGQVAGEVQEQDRILRRKFLVEIDERSRR